METGLVTYIVVKIGNHNVDFLKGEMFSFPKMYDLLCYTSGRGHVENLLVCHSTKCYCKRYK